MNILKRFWNWIRKRKPQPSFTEASANEILATQPTFTEASVEVALEKLEHYKEQRERERWLPKPQTRRHRPIPKRPRRKPKAQHDIGKFMKGKSKHQHKTYRASVKAKIQPEDD